MFCNMQTVKLPHDPGLIDDYVKKQLTFIDELLKANETTMSIMTSLDYLNKYTAYDLNFTSKEYYFYSHNIDEMLINCHFNNERCSREDFEFFYSMGSGSCYKFNSGKFNNGTTYELKKSTSPGRRNGLNLELYTGNVSVFYDLIRSTGIKLFIMNSTSYALTDTEGVLLANGYETDIVIQKVRIFYLIEKKIIFK